ncbi:helix-turn-helix domain-containing protein [Weissella viridescens]|uniref:helix-turn-helix domain-containing protein n=1 Tax=Weissella viridescens TaxID=1629 RepID=UPI0017468615|nr:helix-turn-helix domain-containing protein [Weissella viridescens]QOD85602.1 helix-turn-helix domain-containing protein [Weissella viridescens]
MKPEFYLTLFSKQQPRRSHVIFALLKQQTTGSAEYWGLRYQLLDWFGLLPQLRKNEYEQALQQLQQNKDLEQIEPGLYLLTEKGDKVRMQYAQQHYLPQQNAARIQYQTGAFMPLFLQANQVVSEWSYHNRQYYPMQASLKQRQSLKQWFKNQDKTQLVPHWFNTLKAFLTTLPEATANSLAASWVGHETAGLNYDQMDLPKTWTEFDFYLWQLEQYTALLIYLEQHTTIEDPIVQLYAIVGKRMQFPTSLQTSFDAAKNGQTLVDIAHTRQLKLGTVQEHLLTAAIWLPLDQFPYEQYLTKDLKGTFAQKLTDPDIDAWRFKTVRETADIQEFFNFRLYAIWQTKREQGHA